MVYLSIPRPGLPGRATEPIPIYMDESAALDKLYQGMITLIPGVNYPAYIRRAAELYS